ncbi:hypothetical protein RM553_04955 [Zunongwangia sp. F363]|uniref:Uncharacterized protein n=1 Tax=Autumnicola tepida TaxID=3075595 RepID=A0ABU3C757_9FLAO|nr:hypothetical protein [Zunongwangia sp. F363]MDT0642176.1 hypothetical protein [Zunongwangia sp. F363]
MKLHFYSPDPNILKDEIIESIEEKTLKTWSLLPDEDTTYLKHTKQ